MHSHRLRACIHRCWLGRSDAALPLGALEVHYNADYFRGVQVSPAHLPCISPASPLYLTASHLHRGVQVSPAHLCAFAAHAHPILVAAAGSEALETTLAASLLRAVIADAAADALEAEGAAAELRTFYDAGRAEALLRQTIAGCEDDAYAAAPDRWVDPFACVELAEMLMAGGDLDGAAAQLEAASAVPPRHYSFHSWHQARVRAVRGRLRLARAASGDEEDEEEAEEAEDVARLRKEVEAAEAADRAARAEAAAKAEAAPTR